MAETEFTDIFLTVHGIGKQQRNATVRSVANRLASSNVLFAEGQSRPFHPQPLGYFQSTSKDVEAFALDGVPHPERCGTTTGVAEVFWADIPQDVADEGRTLEEIKAWAHTVVGRASNSYRSYREKAEKEGKKLKGDRIDFGLAAQVLDEIIDTVRVLERLSKVAVMAGLPEMNLREVFEEFLGDVQFMAEFRGVRSEIIGRFHGALADLDADERTRGADIHIVAHSEGTVVSFLGLLQAMSGQIVSKEGDVKYDQAIPKWLKRVRSYMTIGSPIDKHILLWPDLFEDLDLAKAKRHFNSDDRKIQWRNYYDYGDPVGFRLDSARSWLDKDERACHPFSFDEDDDDIGFARYPLAGKAHNDYWNDPDVFEHFLSSAVVPVVRNRQSADDAGEADEEPATTVERPATRKLVYVLSPGLPYLISALLFLGAVAAAYFPIRPHVEVLKGLESGGEQIACRILGLTGLLIGITLAARIPRLGSTRFRYAWGLFAFGVGVVLYATLVDGAFREHFGEAGQWIGIASPTLVVILFAAVLAVVGLVATKRSRAHERKFGSIEERKRRKFLRGMRPFLIFGVFLVVVLVLPALIELRKEEDSEFSLFLALLGLAAFFYLWWLAALIFDLGFVWQRYVRNEGVEARIGEWCDLPRRKWLGKKMKKAANP